MNTISPFLTVHLSDDLKGQQTRLDDVVRHVINEDTDMFIVTKDQQKLPCHKSFLSLFSPLIDRLLSGASSCSSPIIFLPDFPAHHIKKLLDILKSGHVLSGKNVNDDIKIVHNVANVLEITITNLNVVDFGSVNNNLCAPFENETKQEKNNEVGTDKILQDIQKSFDGMNKLLNDKDNLDNIVQKDVANEKQKIIDGKQEKEKGSKYLKLVSTDKIIKQENTDNFDKLLDTSDADGLQNLGQNSPHEKNIMKAASLKQKTIQIKQEKLEGSKSAFINDKNELKDDIQGKSNMESANIKQNPIQVKQEKVEENENMNEDENNQRNLDDKNNLHTFVKDAAPDDSIKRKGEVSITNNHKKSKIKVESDTGDTISPEITPLAHKINEKNPNLCNCGEDPQHPKLYHNVLVKNKLIQKQNDSLCTCGQVPQHPSFRHDLLVKQNVLKPTYSKKQTGPSCKCRKLPEHPPFLHKVLANQNLLKTINKKRPNLVSCVCRQIPEHPPFLYQLLETENLLKPRGEQRQDESLCVCGQLPQHGQFFHDLLVKEGTIHYCL